jgi:hypothetical protein
MDSIELHLPPKTSQEKGAPMESGGAPVENATTERAPDHESSQMSREGTPPMHFLSPTTNFPDVPQKDASQGSISPKSASSHRSRRTPKKVDEASDALSHKSCLPSQGSISPKSASSHGSRRTPKKVDKASDKGSGKSNSSNRKSRTPHKEKDSSKQVRKRRRSGSGSGSGSKGRSSGSSRSSSSSSSSSASSSSSGSSDSWVTEDEKEKEKESPKQSTSKGADRSPSPPPKKDWLPKKPRKNSAQDIFDPPSEADTEILEVTFSCPFSKICS